MKKVFAFVFITALILTLCACGDSGSSDSEKSVVPVVSGPADEPEEESKKEESKKEESKKEESKKEESKKEESKKEESGKEDSKESSEESSADESSEEESSEPESEPSEESLEESSESEPVSEPESEEESEEISEEESEEISEEESQPEVSREPKPAPVLTGDEVSSEWFDDAVFIGDSVTLKLSYFCDYNDDLGDAKFLCAGSLGYNNAQWDLYRPDNVHPSYNGTKYLVDQGAAATGAKKIFIMLGMNDIGLYGVDGAVDGMKIITKRIEDACPDAVIYVQSVTPMLYGSQLSDLNNTTIAEFNRRIQPICQERGYVYLDVASAVDDGYGNLVYEYCGDPTAMGLHFSDEGCRVWINYLKHNVG